MILLKPDPFPSLLCARSFLLYLFSCPSSRRRHHRRHCRSRRPTPVQVPAASLPSRMESLYRMWIRNHRERFDLEALDELRRELQTALGTTKWQLVEFEKAVKVTHKSHSLEENIITRHREFVVAIGNQILHVEELNGSLIKEGKNQCDGYNWTKKNEMILHFFFQGHSKKVDKQTSRMLITGINRLIERSRNCFSNSCQWSKPSHSLHHARGVCRSQRNIAGSQYHMHFSRFL